MTLKFNVIPVKDFSPLMGLEMTFLGFFCRTNIHDAIALADEMILG
jgi:hypothetical protein